jgi:hypothetical protein
MKAVIGRSFIRSRFPSPVRPATRYRALIKQGKSAQSADWDDAFRTQTGQNVNFSVNAVAKTIEMLVSE